jgi:hypothetical protein
MDQRYLISIIQKKSDFKLLEKEFVAESDEDAKKQVKDICKYMAVLSKFNGSKFETLSYLTLEGKWGKLN